MKEEGGKEGQVQNLHLKLSTFCLIIKQASFILAKLLFESLFHPFISKRLTNVFFSSYKCKCWNNILHMGQKG